MAFVALKTKCYLTLGPQRRHMKHVTQNVGIQLLDVCNTQHYFGALTKRVHFNIVAELDNVFQRAFCHHKM